MAALIWVRRPSQCSHAWIYVLGTPPLLCCVVLCVYPLHRTCVWQKLPEGWLEFHDSITQQPYYYNPTTRQKTWARPVEQAGDAPKVTATRLMSMEQPKSCLPSFNKRRSGSLTTNGQANSSSSALSGRDGVTPLTSPSAVENLGQPDAPLQTAQQQQQDQQAAQAAELESN